MIRRLLLEDFQFKALALVLSLVLFFFVRGDRISEVGVIVPVIYQLPEGKVLVGDPVKKLRVTVSGRQTKLRSILRTGMDPIQVDLTQFQGKVYYFDDTTLKVDPSLRLLSVQPAKADIEMEQRVSKEVPIAPNLLGNPDPAFRLTQVSVAPRRVAIEGARSLVNPITEVKTIPVDVEGRWETTEIEVGLSQPDPGVTFVIPGQKAKVHLEFESRRDERVLAALAIEAVNTSWQTSLAPATVNLRVEAPVKLLAGIEGSGIKAVVDLRELEGKPGGSTHRVEVELMGLPEGVKLLEMRPQRTLVKLLQRLESGARPPTEGTGEDAAGKTSP